MKNNKNFYIENEVWMSYKKSNKKVLVSKGIQTHKFGDIEYNIWYSPLKESDKIPWLLVIKVLDNTDYLRCETFSSAKYYANKLSNNTLVWYKRILYKPTSEIFEIKKIKKSGKIELENGVVINKSEMCDWLILW